MAAAASAATAQVHKQLDCLACTANETCSQISDLAGYRHMSREIFFRKYFEAKSAVEENEKSSGFTGQSTRDSHLRHISPIPLMNAVNS
jgi:hypothetical protein